MNSKDCQDMSPIMNECTAASSNHTETINHFLPTFEEIEKKLASLEAVKHNEKSVSTDESTNDFDLIRKVKDQNASSADENVFLKNIALEYYTNSMSNHLNTSCKVS